MCHPVVSGDLTMLQALRFLGVQMVVDLALMSTLLN